MISHARGLVQCGQCDRSFSSLSFIFDEWPSGEAHRPEVGPDATLPIIGRASTAVTNVETTSAKADETDPENTKPAHLVWAISTALLVLLTLANIVWTFREPLLNNPRINTWMNQTGGLQVEQQGLLKDPQQIQLVSRDMHTHPTRSGILILSLTFVNLAQRSQVFPELEITLVDAANQPVAQRQFHPVDYLRPGADTRDGLTTDVYLPVLLELVDPGELAVGFEIQFL